MVSASPTFDTFYYASPTSAKYDHEQQLSRLDHRLVVRSQQQCFRLDKPKGIGSFEYEFIYYCAATDESAGERLQRDASTATAAATATVDRAEEWIGQVPEFDLMSGEWRFLTDFADFDSSSDTLPIDIWTVMIANRPDGDAVLPIDGFPVSSPALPTALAAIILERRHFRAETRTTWKVFGARLARLLVK
jgi:hypothetical protein